MVTPTSDYVSGRLEHGPGTWARGFLTSSIVCLLCNTLTYHQTRVSRELDPQEFILYERLLTPVVVVKDLLSNKNNSLMSTT